MEKSLEMKAWAIAAIAMPSVVASRYTAARPARRSRSEPRRMPTSEATPAKVATTKETKRVRFPNAAMACPRGCE